jgi:ABC-type nitrate/sulfonate/bicarbonate transport system substrate-binding protein
MAQATTTWADTLAAKKDVIEKYQRAMVEATRWAYTHKDEMIEAAQKHIPVSREELSKVYDFYVLAQVWAINGEADRARLVYMQDLGVKLQTQNKAVDVDKLLDLGIYKNVTAKLGTRDYPKTK